MFQNERDRLAEICQAFFTRFALAVGPWYFSAIRDVPWPIPLDNRGELVVHGPFYRTLQTGSSGDLAAPVTLPNNARGAEVAFPRALGGPSFIRKQVGGGTNRRMPTLTPNTTAQDNSSEITHHLHLDICGSAGCDVTTEVKAPYSAIVLGATGNVGGRIVQLLIQSSLCKKVVVVTRRKTDAFADSKVSEVVVNMDRLEVEVAPHAQGVDVALAAFGVGKGSAKMPEEEVRKIEVAYSQAFCRAARTAGARVCAVMTAVGADPAAGMKYAKIIGEKEKAVESVKFDFLGVYRPAVILGNSNTPGVLGYVMPLLHWAMPSKYHSIHKNDLARAMVAQSEQAFLAIAQGSAPKKATVKILEYKEMEPFFVKGERGA